MRCPYCGSMNIEKAAFCKSCGRGLAQTTDPNRIAQSQSPQSPYLPKPPVKKDQAQTRYPAPPIQTPQPQRVGGQPKAPVTQQPNRMPSTPPLQSQPKVEPPESFPPSTLAQLRELEKEAIPYTVVDEITVAGRKKTLRIVYAACLPWQQVGTLIKAFDEQKLGDSFSLVVIQGSMDKDESLYEYTNGQLQFDRGARLGSQVLNRFQIQTGNGFESNTIRILLEEK